jgi:hypothetical protein
VRTVAESQWAVAQRVNEHTALISVLCDDAARAVRRLGQLRTLCTKVRI